MSLRTPPPTRTGSRASRRRTVTKSEFTAVTDVPPLVTITTYHLLQDEERMKKLAATFCDAIFSSPCQATIGRIIDESLKLCGGSQETLSTVLQTKFFAGHTPFYWAIVNKDPKQAGVPPLLAKLFTICSHTSDVAIEEEIVTALLGLEDSDDNLYQSIAPCLGTVHQQLTPSYFDGTGQQPTVKATTPDAFGMRGTAEFCIPLFFDRLILDREVCLTFITMGSLWCLRAVADGFPNPSLPEWTWHFELKEIKSRHKYSSKYQRTLSINLAHSTEGQGPLLCSATQNVNEVPSSMTLYIPDISLQHLRRNPYTAKRTRELAGVLEIEDVDLPFV